MSALLWQALTVPLPSLFCICILYVVADVVLGSSSSLIVPLSCIKFEVPSFNVFICPIDVLPLNTLNWSSVSPLNLINPPIEANTKTLLEVADGVIFKDKIST